MSEFSDRFAAVQAKRHKRPGLLKQITGLAAGLGPGVLHLGNEMLRTPLRTGGFFIRAARDHNVESLKNVLDFGTAGIFTEGKGGFEQATGGEKGLLPQLLTGVNETRKHVQHPGVYWDALRGKEGAQDLLPLLVQDIGNVAIGAGAAAKGLGMAGRVAEGAGMATAAERLAGASQVAHRVAAVGGEIADMGVTRAYRGIGSRLLPSASAEAIAEAAARGKVPSMWTGTIEAGGRALRAPFEMAGPNTTRGRLRSRFPKVLTDQGRAVTLATQDAVEAGGRAYRETVEPLRRAAETPTLGDIDRGGTHTTTTFPPGPRPGFRRAGSPPPVDPFRTRDGLLAEEQLNALVGKTPMPQQLDFTAPPPEPPRLPPPGRAVSGRRTTIPKEGIFDPYAPDAVFTRGVRDPSSVQVTPEGDLLLTPQFQNHIPDGRGAVSWAPDPAVTPSYAFEQELGTQDWRNFDQGTIYQADLSRARGSSGDPIPVIKTPPTRKIDDGPGFLSGVVYKVPKKQGEAFSKLFGGKEMSYMTEKGVIPGERTPAGDKMQQDVVQGVAQLDTEIPGWRDMNDSQLSDAAARLMPRWVDVPDQPGKRVRERPLTDADRARVNLMDTLRSAGFLDEMDPKGTRAGVQALTDLAEGRAEIRQVPNEANGTVYDAPQVVPVGMTPPPLRLPKGAWRSLSQEELVALLDKPPAGAPGLEFAGITRAVEPLVAAADLLDEMPPGTPVDMSVVLELEDAGLGGADISDLEALFGAWRRVGQHDRALALGSVVNQIRKAFDTVDLVGGVGDPGITTDQLAAQFRQAATAALEGRAALASMPVGEMPTFGDHGRHGQGGFEQRRSIPVQGRTDAPASATRTTVSRLPAPEPAPVVPPGLQRGAAGTNRPSVTIPRQDWSVAGRGRNVEPPLDPAYADSLLGPSGPEPVNMKGVSPKVQAAAAEFGVTPREVEAEMETVKATRAKVAEELSTQLANEQNTLDRMEGRLIGTPPKKRADAGGEWDWYYESLSEAERSALKRNGYIDKPTGRLPNRKGPNGEIIPGEWHTQSNAAPDEIAENFRRNGLAPEDMKDGDVMTEVWLPMVRRIEAVKALAAGKKIPAWVESGKGGVNLEGFSTTAADAGLDVAEVMTGPQPTAAAKLAAAARESHARLLGGSTFGPAAHKMSFESWADEVQRLEADPGFTTSPEMQARYDELVPPSIDFGQDTLAQLHADIIDAARRAGETVATSTIVPDPPPARADRLAVAPQRTRGGRRQAVLARPAPVQGPPMLPPLPPSGPTTPPRPPNRGPVTLTKSQNPRPKARTTGEYDPLGPLSLTEQAAAISEISGSRANLEALQGKSLGLLNDVGDAADVSVPLGERNFVPDQRGRMHPEFQTAESTTLASDAAGGRLPQAMSDRLARARQVFRDVRDERTAIRQTGRGQTLLDPSQIDVRPSPMPIDEVVAQLESKGVITSDEAHHLNGEVFRNNKWVAEGLTPEQIRARRVRFYESEPRFMENTPALADPTLYASAWRPRMAEARNTQGAVVGRADAMTDARAKLAQQFPDMDQSLLDPMVPPELPQTPMQLGKLGVAPEYVPSGRTHSPTVGLPRRLDTLDSLQGTLETPAEKVRSAEHPVGPVTFDPLGERLGAEARRSEMNHRFTKVTERGGKMGAAFGWDGTGQAPDNPFLTPEELVAIHARATQLTAEGGKFQRHYNEELVRAMEAKGWEPWPETGAIGRPLTLEDRVRTSNRDTFLGVNPADIGPTTPWLRHGLRNELAPYITPRIPGAVIRALAKGNQLFKKGTLAPNVRWQIGDAMFQYLMAGMDHIAPWEYRRYIKKAQEIAGRVGDVPRERVRGRKAQSTMRYGGSEAGRRLFDSMEMQNLRLDNPMIDVRPNTKVRPGEQPLPGQRVTRAQKLFDPNAGRFVDASFRYNQVSNATRREAMALVQLDRRLKKQGFSLDDPGMLDRLAKASNATDAALYQDVMGAIDRTNKLFGNTDRLSPFERDYLTHAFPFWTWTSTVARLMGMLAVHHPARLLFTLYVGGMVANDSSPDLPGYQGTVKGPGGFWPTAFTNPFADIGGLPGMDEGNIGPGSLLRSASPMLKLPAALAGFDLGQGEYLSRAPGTARRGAYGKESYSPIIGDLGAMAYQTLSQIPLGKRVLNVLPRMTIPLPGTDITTGNVVRYDTGESMGFNAGTPLPTRLGSLIGLPLPMSQTRAAESERLVREREAQWQRGARDRRRAANRRRRLTSQLPRI